MNQRRQELERSLPEASKYLCDFIWRECRGAAVNVSDQDILFIGRLVSEYFTNSTTGKLTALKMLNATVTEASALKTYFPEGYLNDESRRLKHSDLQHYSGWIYKKTLALPEGSVDVDDREDAVICDSCGGRFPQDYCTRNVEVYKTNGQSRVETWCNHCRSSSEQPRVRETSSTKTCTDCEKILCEFHPRHATTILASAQKCLPAPAPRGPSGWFTP